MADATEHPNVTRYRRRMAAFNAGDLGTISELVAPDVDYVVQEPVRERRASGAHRPTCGC